MRLPGRKSRSIMWQTITFGRLTITHWTDAATVTIFFPHKTHINVMDMDMIYTRVSREVFYLYVFFVPKKAGKNVFYIVFLCSRKKARKKKKKKISI